MLKVIGLGFVALAALLYACGRGDGSGLLSTAVGRGPARPLAQSDGAPTTTTSTTSTTRPSAPPPTAVDLAVRDVAAPHAAAPIDDGCGGVLGFGADDMVDGSDETAWAMAGDGTGKTVTLVLEGPRRVLSVGLVPGLDRIGCDDTDHFRQIRRISQVTWEFDDGTTARQELLDVGTLQRIAVDATTTTVRLHIDDVTADPAQDYTAISEVGVRGV